MSYMDPVTASDPVARQQRFQSVVTLMLLGALCVWVAWLTWERFGTGPLHVPSTPREVTPRGNLAEIEQSRIQLFEDARASVVAINTSARVARYRGGEVPAGSGSGFVWDDQGHVVTNVHVIKDAAVSGGHIQVMTYDGGTYEATLVGAAPEHDLAVVRVKAAANLQKIRIGSSADLRVGQSTFAIGNPFGLRHSMTTGIISALGREVRTEQSVIEDAIQTDAAINPGNSGGPLLDSSGRLIGVNTAIQGQQSSGVGFAIPVDTVNQVVPRLISGAPRVQMGVRLDYDDVNQRAGGVHITQVVPGSPAEAAGLRGERTNEDGDTLWGDIILAIDGKAVKLAQDVTRFIAARKPGDEVTLQVLRGRRKLEVKVKLAAK